MLRRACRGLNKGMTNMMDHLKDHIEDLLAAAGAIVVLLAVAFAANSALADEADGVSATAIAIHTAGSISAARGRKANGEAMAETVEALRADTALDLDIRLRDHTSTLVAGAYSRP